MTQVPIIVKRPQVTINLGLATAIIFFVAAGFGVLIIWSVSQVPFINTSSYAVSKPIDQNKVSCQDDLSCPKQKKCQDQACVDVGCVEAGESIPGAISPDYRDHMALECCAGLQSISWPSLFDENCSPVMLMGAPSGLCANCGDGLCDSQKNETKCNCPADCLNIMPE